MSKEYDQETADQVCGYFKSIGEASVSKQKTAGTGTSSDTSSVPTSVPMSPDMNACVSNLMKSKGYSMSDAVRECTTTTKIRESSAGDIVDKFSPDNQRFFIKAFLLNADVNGNRWGVSKQSLPQLVQTFVGKPLVLTEDFDHPELHDTESLQHALQYQETFRIGNISEISYNNADQTYYAIIEITDPRAKAAFAAGDLPLYVSPAIAKLDPFEQDGQINKWLAMHLAIVDDPAYTVKKAIVSGQCGGSSEQCLMQLRKAHVEKFGPTGCGFCIKKVLMAKVAEKYKDRTGQQLQVPLDGNESELDIIAKTVKASNTDPAINDIPQVTFSTTGTNSTGSINVNISGDKTGNSLTDFSATSQQEDILVDTNNSSNAQPSQAQAQQPKQVQQQQPISTENSVFTAADYEKLKAKCETQEGIILDQQQTIERISSQLKTLDDQYKKAEFEKIITADIIENDDERKNKIAYFISKNMSPDEVRDIYKSIIEVKQKYAASLPQAGTGPTIQQAKVVNASDGVYHNSYDAKVPYRTAGIDPTSTGGNPNGNSNDTTDEEPAWIRLRNLTIAPTNNNNDNLGGVS